MLTESEIEILVNAMSNIALAAIEQERCRDVTTVLTETKYTAKAQIKKVCIEELRDKLYNLQRHE